MNFTIAVASYIVVACIAFWRGYEFGVKETEVRWNETVGRADDARKQLGR